MIPKIIHYCWLSDDPVPENLKKYMSSWSEKLPEYEFIKWDFSRFDKESSVWVSEAFDSKKYAFAADYIRLFAVYNYGGIYMDMDIEVLKDFGDLLEKPYMFAREVKNVNRIEAGCFGAEKGNAFIKSCLDYYGGRHFVSPEGIMDTTPLPVVMQGVLEKNSIELELYGCDVFTVKSYKDGSINVTDNSYTIHHFAGSWMNSALARVIKIKHYIADKNIVIRIIGHMVAIPFAITGLYQERGLKGMVGYYYHRIKDLKL